MCGWIGLVPIFGIPTAIRAIVLYKQVQEELQPAPSKRNEASDYLVSYEAVEETKREWNPAKKYLVLGCTLAWCGLVFSLLLVGGLTLLALRVLLQ